MQEHAHPRPKARPQVSDGATTRLFENPILEGLTRTHIAIPLVIFYGSAVFAWAYYASIGVAAILVLAASFLGGFLLFTLIEYLVHRYVFHMLADTPGRERIQYMFHGVHHEYPRDKERLAMPPIVSMLIAGILLSLLQWIGGPPGVIGGTGFLSGYATYLLVHYSIHRFKPPKNGLRMLWKNHNIHHFKDDTVAYGVSSPLWDYVFGTFPYQYYKKSRPSHAR
jgi:sterol desaturase/sphingolipid hydroxylase (fatty acid hydroxylase superfamily)